MLHGGTADVASARAAGVRIGLGSDWAPSGSKNLLGELKVARIYAQEKNLGLSDHDLVAMATREAAAILHWQDGLGSLPAGKDADLLVVEGDLGDSYTTLLSATEASISLVMVNGVPRLGRSQLMRGLRVDGEKVVVVRQHCLLNLSQAVEDPAIAEISLAKATAQLTDACAGYQSWPRRKCLPQIQQPGLRLPLPPVRSGTWPWTS